MCIRDSPPTIRPLRSHLYRLVRPQGSNIIPSPFPRQSFGATRPLRLGAS
ncbi:hypothetical protein [uncultured Porphyromonas sp.]|nr:hypothetical protein [uncultured Porphyromonas sp.]